jgi:hypothetical protein
VVRVIERIPAGYRAFADVKPELLKREQETQFQKKLAEYLDKLKRDAVIRVAPDVSAYYKPAVQVTPAPEPPKETKKKG